MAVALGMPPDSLLACDDELLDHLVVLAQRERTMRLWTAEVAATTAELVHALWRLTYQANVKRGTTIPEPLKIPRPWLDEARPRRRVSSLGDLARRMMGGG